LIWNSSHDLDPYKPLDSAVKPVTIQVVALRWKWLFIYPEQGVASVNYVQFPEDTPVNFVITSDAPMNSFWIPQLGGQVYAMPGMSTKLHLIADHTGDYAGSSANLSGAGFASMKFRARSTSSSDFDEWVRTIKQSDSLLTADNYANDLAMPSQNNPVEYYMLGDDNLYESALGKSMMHGSATEEHQSTNIQ
jgi:cytochrome o ubiquinol oxidase subunit 2